MSWYPFDKGKSIGRVGSESGIILRDDEHDCGARITLERNAKIAPFAITCGIYGWMVHTRFLSVESEAQDAFDAMEQELSRIIEQVPLKTDPEVDAKSAALCDSIAAFVEKFPT